MSCPSIGYCVAATDGVAVTYANGAWGTPRVIVPADVHVGGGFILDCATTAFCVALDASGNAVVYNGGTWGRVHHVTRYSFGLVSCPRAGYCVAVDTDGDVLYYRGHSWTRPHRIDSSAPPVALSCAPATRACVLILGSEFGGSYVMMYNGRRWTSPTLIAGAFRRPGWHDLGSVSCASAIRCVAVGGRGYASVYDGHTWHATTYATNNRSDNAGVSCPVATRCTVVDTSGDAYSFQPPRT